MRREESSRWNLPKQFPRVGKNIRQAAEIWDSTDSKVLITTSSIAIIKLNVSFPSDFSKRNIADIDHLFPKSSISGSSHLFNSSLSLRGKRSQVNGKQTSHNDDFVYSHCNLLNAWRHFWYFDCLDRISLLQIFSTRKSNEDENEMRLIDSPC